MAKRYGLIGFPLKHSYSAIMQNAAFKELGINAQYELFEIKPEDLEAEFKELVNQGVCGFNVTAPYKEKIIRLLDTLEPHAELIGAVNTINISENRKSTGFNTDGAGFITHLTEVVGFNPRGKKIALLGAGGAAKAISMGLAEHQASDILVFDLEGGKAKELVDRLRRNFPQCKTGAVTEADELLQSHPDLLINATPVGMHKEDRLIIDTGLFYPELIVYDLIYNPAQTQLLMQAKRKGCRGVFNGLGMLLYQGVLAFKIWMGVQPPVEIMEKALTGVLNNA